MLRSTSTNDSISSKVWRVPINLWIYILCCNRYHVRTNPNLIRIKDLYIVEVFFYVMKYLTHPLTVCNLIIVGSLVFIEALHINFHKGLTTCDAVEKGVWHPLFFMLSYNHSLLYKWTFVFALSVMQNG